MPTRTLHRLLPLVLCALFLVACGGGGGGSAADPGPQPPSITFDEQETDLNGQATVRIAGTPRTITFEDNLTGDPLPGLYVEVVEKAPNSILTVSDPAYGTYATYSSFVDDTTFSKMGLGRRVPSIVADGTWGVDFIDDVIVGVPGVLSYTDPELWLAWLERYGDFDGDASVGGLDAWLFDLIDAEATAEIVHVIAARDLETPGQEGTMALLSGAATYEETVLTPWLALWSDWYRQACYGEGDTISVYVTLDDTGTLLTIFLWPVDVPPDATVGYGGIEGRVYDLDTGDPIAGAAVVPAHLWMESITDPSGAYLLAGVDVACDRYAEVIFVVEAEGYRPYGFTGAQAGLNGTAMTGLDLWLEPALPWTFYGPDQFTPTGTWSTSPEIDWAGTELAWGTGPFLTAASDAVPLFGDPPGLPQVEIGDRIEFEVRYLGHNDPNGRQQVFSGFADALDVDGATPLEFAGVRTADAAGSARTEVVFSKGGASVIPYSLTHAKDVPTTLRVLVIVTSTTEYRLVVDRDGIEIHNATHLGNLVGIAPVSCAVWNASTGLDPLEGGFSGGLAYVGWRGS